MNSKTKLILIIILGLLFIFPLGVRSYADENSDIEEWAKSEDVLLDKVRYETKTRKLTVELTQTKQEIAHEYELYLMIEGDLDNAIGRYLSLGKILSILGIMTVDVNDRVKVYLTGSGKNAALFLIADDGKVIDAYDVNDNPVLNKVCS